MNFSEEDKVWLSQVIDGALGARFDSLGTRFTALETRVGAVAQEIAALKVSMVSDVEHQIAALKVSIERVETSLLAEFHKWAGPLEMRMRSHGATLRALDLEMEALGERVTKLEPPH